MKILQIAPLWASVPPKKYGGTELIVSQVCDGLVIRGNQVTLYATGDSKTKANLKPVVASALGEGVERGEFGPDFVIKNEVLANFLAFSKATEYDIVHAHSHYLGASFSNFISKPCVITLHSYPKGPELEIMKKSKASFVSISDKFREVSPGLNFVETVYNGIDLKYFTFEDTASDHMIAIGRVSSKKGLGEAIEIAIKSKHDLKLAGPLPKKALDKKSWLVDERYFAEKISNFINKKGVSHVGEISESEKSRFFRAKALLFPISWEEPFGLVMIEAMATGTPVIAFAQGSVPEVVEDGKTGFIVNISDKDKRGNWIIKESGITGMIQAVKKLYSMPNDEYHQMRQNSRKRVEKNFTLDTMVDGYEEVYRKILNTK